LKSDSTTTQELDETCETFRVDVSDPCAPELEARLGKVDRAGGPVAVVAPPHPLLGGSLDNPVVESLTRGLAAAGCRTLRFNWRGVGASTGAASGDIDDAVADYRAALEYLASLARSAWPGDDALDTPTLEAAAAPDTAAVVAAGYSFGAVAAVRVAVSASHAGTRACVARLVLVAPPLAMIELPELSRVTIPVHVIVGDRDEYAPVDRIEAQLDGLAATRLDVIDRTDHFFASGDPRQLASLVAAGMMGL
jgi:alpha/beta superfamily hydrolase